MHLYRRKRKRFSSWLLVPALLLVGVAVLAAGSKRMEETTRREQQELLEEAVNQAVVNCYAMEGRYPESIRYLIENYGIQVDFDRYAVSYEIFADNVKPQVKIIALGEDGDKS